MKTTTAATAIVLITITVCWSVNEALIAITKIYSQLLYTCCESRERGMNYRPKGFALRGKCEYIATCRMIDS